MAPGHRLSLELGPLALELGHGQGEWSLAVVREPEKEESARRAGIRVDRGSPGMVEERFVHDDSKHRVMITPVLADRPVVFRPRQPVFLLSGQEITLYLSTPVHLRIQVGDPPVLLRELHVLRQSDTWFGPSTREGELCYSARTHARHSLAEVPRRAHRAITPLKIRNQAPAPLPLEKISLPVPMLSLYGTADGGLWTQRVVLVREDVSDLATVRVDSALPDAGQPLTRISPPRREPGRGGVVRAFSLLFGQ